METFEQKVVNEKRNISLENRDSSTPLGMWHVSTKQLGMGKGKIYMTKSVLANKS